MRSSYQYRERDYLFGNRCVSLRNAIGVTQGGLAQMLGVTERTIQTWESGSKYPKAGHLKHLIELGTRHEAFAAGPVEAEIRALWKAARTKILLDEGWLRTLLGSLPPEKPPSETTVPSTPSPVPASITQLSAATSPRIEAEPVHVDSPVDFQHLSVPLTQLVGRQQEEQAVCAQLLRPEVRLFTLTGTGGAGKTRLALQVATDLFGTFAHGVCFVQLASISDPKLVVPAIAQALGLREIANRAFSERLHDYLHVFLRDKHLLLVLDNFEQVLSAASSLSDLLLACPRLKILVTSRVVLHVRGEYEFPIPPLALPDPHSMPTLEAILRSPAVILFVQRAQAVKPDFQVTEDNAGTIAQICSRLDGLPLALELAAARIKLLAPHALLSRLGRRLTVLTGGARDTPARQQTLRNTLQWSYDLLSQEEQRCFRRLSVFVGGCTLEAVEEVCAAPGDLITPTLDLVSSLMDKSLLQQVGQESRRQLGCR